MPGFILHTGASVLCMHAGQATPTTTFPKVTLGGQPVITQPTPWTIAGCTLPPPPAANGPCVTAQWITAATKVFTGGAPVLLFDSQAVCTPTGTGLQVVSSQIKVKAT